MANVHEHTNSVDAITADPTKSGFFATGSHDKTIKLWDASNGTCLKTLTGHTTGVQCLNYFPDGKKLLSSSSDGTTRVWDCNSGANEVTLGNHADKCFFAMMNQDGRVVASVGSDKLINIWDLRNTSKPAFTNDESTDVIMSCDFSADGKYLLSSTMGGVINALDLSTQKMSMSYNTLEF